MTITEIAKPFVKTSTNDLIQRFCETKSRQWSRNFL